MQLLSTEAILLGGAILSASVLAAVREKEWILPYGCCWEKATNAAGCCVLQYSPSNSQRG